MQVLTEEQKEHKRQYNRARYHARKNLETEQSRRKNYYKDNSEHIKLKSIDNYYQNYDDKKIKKKIWQLKRKEKSKTNVDETFREMLSSIRTRSKKLGRECNVDLEHLHELWNNQQGLCNLSKLPMSSEIGSKWKKVSPDRIDSNSGYVKGNVQLVLASVNMFKMSMNQDEFIALCKAIAKNT